MTGHALTHKRAEHFLMPPMSLLIIGLDTDDVAGSHPLWRADAKDSVPDARFIDSIRKHGIIQPVRARKISTDNKDTAEVIVGRERVKAARLLEAEGMTITVPTLLWPMGTPDSEIIGAANAENYQRKTESVVLQAEHVAMQLRANGYFDGIDENECLKSVSVSTGMGVQRIRNLLAFREDSRLTQAVMAQINGQPGIGGEAALAIATLPKEEREKQLAIILADPSKGTIVEVRERVAYTRAAAKAAKEVHNGVALTDGKANGAAEKSKKAENKSEKSKKTGNKSDDITDKSDKSDGPALGLSKPLQKRIVAAQMALPAGERDVDQLVLKVLKVTAGLAAPSSVPGLAKVLRDLGL